MPPVLGSGPVRPAAGAAGEGAGLTLVWCALAFVVGIVVGESRAPAPALLVAAAVAGGAVAGWWWSRSTSRHLGLMLALLALGALRWEVDRADAWHASADLVRRHGEMVTARGWVSAEPVELERVTRLRITVEAMAPAVGLSGRSPEPSADAPRDPAPGGPAGGNAGRFEPATGDLLATVPAGTGYRYGDRLALTGRLTQPPVFDGFDYRTYLERQGIAALLRYPRVERLPGSEGDPLRRALYQLKAALRDSLARHVPEPQAGLLVGVLLGTRTAMPPALLDAFSATNLTHLLAISGWNMTLVGGWAGTVAAALARGRRLPTLLLVGATLVLYSLLVGATPSVVRAALMGGIGLLAGWTGRRRDALPALGCAALVMTAWTPPIVWDVGFQLSFLATLGIVLWSEPLASRLRRLGARADGTSRLPAWLVEGVAVTLAAELATMPLIAVDFNRVSLVGLAANLALAWTMTPIMVLGGLTALVGLVGPLDPLATGLGLGAWAFAAILTRGVEWFAALPLASVEVGEVDPRLPALWYLALAAWTVAREPEARGLLRRVAARLHPAPPGLVLWCGAWTVVLVALWLQPPTPAPDRLHVLWPRADALLARSGAGTTALIDGAADDPAASSVALADEALSALARRLPFWQRRVDLLVPTAPAPGPLGGLVAVARRYTVGAALLPRDPSGEVAVSALRDLETVLQGRGADVATAAPGATARVDSLVLRVLAVEPSTPTTPVGRVQPGTTTTPGPPGGAVAGRHPPSAGGRITALRLDVGALSVLWLDDLSEGAQRTLLAEGAVEPVDVLRLPARGSLVPELLAAAAPRVIVLPEPPRTAAGTSPLAALPPEALAEVEVWWSGPEGTIEIARIGTTLATRRLR